MYRTTALSLLTGAALAAAAPAMAQTTGRSWTGPYVGAQLGYAFQPKDRDEILAFDTNRDGKFGDQVTTAAGANAFSPGFCGGRAIIQTAANGCGSDVNAVNWRVHAGYDYQLGDNLLGGGVVVGGIAEFGRTNTVMDYATAFSTTPASYTFSREYRYGANVRGRLGYALGDTLLYGTGGGSWASIYYRFGTSNTANSFTLADRRKNEYGWNAGGGLDQRIGDHFTIGLMYLFTGIKADGERVAVGPGTAPATNPFLRANPTGTDIVRTGKTFYIHSLNVSASYRF